MNKEHKLIIVGSSGLVISLLPTILLFLKAGRILDLLGDHAFMSIVSLSFGGAIVTSISIGMAINNRSIAVVVTPFVAIGIGMLSAMTNVFAGFAY